MLRSLPRRRQEQRPKRAESRALSPFPLTFILLDTFVLLMLKSRPVKLGEAFQEEAHLCPSRAGPLLRA